jgi:hypothetical protein
MGLWFVSTGNGQSLHRPADSCASHLAVNPLTIALPLKIPLKKGGKEGETTVVVKPSGGCPYGFGEAERTPPGAARPPSLRAAPFVKGE